MIAHFFNKGIFLRPTGSGSLWKQAVGATRWRNIFFFFEETWCFDVICKSRNIYRCHCWTMTSAPNIHSKVIYECCEAPYLDITVYLMLRWLYRGMFGKRPDFFFCTFPYFFPYFHNIRMFPFQAQNTLLFLQSDRAMCPHCQVSKKIF